MLGKNIRTKRLQKRLSQEELAFRISSTRNYIGCIERGEKAPSISIVLDIAKELGCQINELFINI
ncbi:helix-turn-helix transcriptional regulator [bacterium]|nr:helix-turn-helix transcriptional regulator [bacterium]